jgi:stage III sporulation protein AC
MTIQILFKIGAVGILVALLNQILKHSGKEEHAFLLNLAGLIIVLSWIIPYIVDLFNQIMELMNI